jgi:hypothetical protein
VALERLATEPLRRFLKVHSYGAARGAEKRAKEVIDQLFCALVICPLSAWGWWVMLRHNGPCTPLAPKGCLVGWPDHPMSDQFRWWWLTVGGMYTGEVVGTLMGGVGFKLSKEMLTHHAITLVMMVGLVAVGAWGGWVGIGASGRLGGCAVFWERAGRGMICLVPRPPPSPPSTQHRTTKRARSSSPLPPPLPPLLTPPPSTPTPQTINQPQLYGYFGGLHRYGQMATTVLDTSNGFLHLAKLVHATGLPQLAPVKDGIFKLFALVFFIVRVVIPPFAMVGPGLVYGRVMPTKTYLITNALMMAIYSLQLMW